MTQIRFGNSVVDTDLVIFDKDGTLIDFDHLWGRKTVACVEQLVETVGGDDQLRQALYDALGYDPEHHRTLGDGPLAVASMEKIYRIAAATLRLRGFDPDVADEQVDVAFRRGMAVLPASDMIRPLADLKQLVRQLTGAGVAVAVATSDDREPTQAMLVRLGVETGISLLACGDDAIRVKPAPDAILALCEQLDVPPSRAVMVGDTLADMMMGKAAEVGCRVAVLSGVEGRDGLAANADIVIDSIAEIVPHAG